MDLKITISAKITKVDCDTRTMAQVGKAGNRTVLPPLEALGAFYKLSDEILDPLKLRLLSDITFLLTKQVDAYRLL